MGLVEIVVGCAIITAGILALIYSYGTYVKFALTNDQKIQATYLLEEGLEALTLRRDDDWATNIAGLTASTTYALYFNGTTWTLSSTTQEYVDGGFWRSFAVYNVSRDTSDQIVTSGGTNDANTRKVTVFVSYLTAPGVGTTTLSLSKYLSNI